MLQANCYLNAKSISHERDLSYQWMKSDIGKRKDCLTLKLYILAFEEILYNLW